MIDCVLRKYGHKPKYPKVKYYGPSDYKPITGTVSRLNSPLLYLMDFKMPYIMRFRR